MVLECNKSSSTQKTENNISDIKQDEANIDLEESASESANPKSPASENTEQAPEVSTSTADDLLQKKQPEDVALILSAEEAELGAASEEPDKESTPVSVVKPKRMKKEASKSVWVSNISRSTKAADLKKLFSGNFKVESAKIVTNGKSFFGYISLETAEMVQRSVKDLNGFNLAGRIISVSLMRPDLRSGRASTGEHVRRGREKQREQNLNEEKKIKDNKLEDKSEISKDIVKDSDDHPVEKKPDSQDITTSPKDKIKKRQRQETKPDRRDKIIENLKKELNTTNSELRITKRRLKDADNRVEFERSKKLELIKDVSKLESQLKLERRRFSQEREQADKKRKLDEIRYEDDRVILNKELEECKKLREYLQMKVDEMREEPRRRARSPIRRSPTRRAGPNSRNLPNRGYGSMTAIPRSRVLHISPPKQRGYESAQERQCIAPSPPKINKRSPPLRRSHEKSPAYKANKKTRMDYPSTSYPSGQSGGNKMPLAHYPTTNSLSAPPKGNSAWNSSYKMPYRYPATSGQGAYPLVQGEIMHPSRYNPTRQLECQDYHKRIPGGPRKY